MVLITDDKVAADKETDALIGRLKEGWIVIDILTDYWGVVDGQPEIAGTFDTEREAIVFIARQKGCCQLAVMKTYKKGWV